jgi:hypothetical protein
MGAGYQVILSDLGQLATAFGNESSTLKTLAPKLAPPPVGTGDAGLDATLQSLLDTFGVYGTALTKALSDHASKLSTCHNNYKQNDADVVLLFNTMISELEQG